MRGSGTRPDNLAGYGCNNHKLAQRGSHAVAFFVVAYPVPFVGIPYQVSFFSRTLKVTLAVANIRRTVNLAILIAILVIAIGVSDIIAVGFAFPKRIYERRRSPWKTAFLSSTS